MKPLKIACTMASLAYFTTGRSIVLVDETDFTDVAAVVLTDMDLKWVDSVTETRFGIPLFLLMRSSRELDDEIEEKISCTFDCSRASKKEISQEIEVFAGEYQDKVLPPFFKTLCNYVEIHNTQFDCPGHQGGQYFMKHPSGRYLYEFYGENVFKTDICNADVALGDLLIHEGPAVEAEMNAARVYKADKTYFVMNGTSTANTITVNALVVPGDLVLFDRNNHKSVYNSALVQSGGNAVYLETERNPYGFIGGIDDHCFEEEYLRELASAVDSVKSEAKRPFRLAVIQLGTYDGTIYNARQVVDRIGHLCDYILFDSAWVGYEQFIPMMRDCSPLLLELNEADPGIIVTQSVHKQQAGFSQSSYIHKKDEHIKGQKRYIDHKRFNNAFRLHTSTSPFYPLFAVLDVNARMQDGEAGRHLWAECVKMGIEARKQIMKRCTMLKPFIPPRVRNRNWEDWDTEEIASSIEFFKFEPGAKWHSFEGYGEDQYFVDPNKLMLTTPGINAESGEYEDFGIPASILANYLREHRIIPEKNDLNSILFLMTPAESPQKMELLISQLEEFERLVREDAPVSEVLPDLYRQNQKRYEGYTIRTLCLEMHQFYRKNDVKTHQKKLFRAAYFPERVMTPQAAHYEFLKNNTKLVKLQDILGEIALEGALPYPPGIYCVVPGERWNETAQKYFLILEEGINQFPGFAPEIQGVYLEKEGNSVKAYGYVLAKED
ncbi:ornithine decarboxylase [Anoxybacterium hadale]|uniref:Ornithine decarboxylase n=1 Tax=Anoxybacterium hadale TaxID=3408580 RepID=A0ACD1A6M3_9FIRM|nr:ornithine decarboxylase [Clostridiales bacterium]